MKWGTNFMTMLCQTHTIVKYITIDIINMSKTTYIHNNIFLEISSKFLKFFLPVNEVYCIHVLNILSTITMDHMHDYFFQNTVYGIKYITIDILNMSKTTYIYKHLQFCGLLYSVNCEEYN